MLRRQGLASVTSDVAAGPLEQWNVAEKPNCLIHRGLVRSTFKLKTEKQQILLLGKT